MLAQLLHRLLAVLVLLVHRLLAVLVLLVPLQIHAVVSPRGLLPWLDDHFLLPSPPPGAVVALPLPFSIVVLWQNVAL